MKKDKGMCVLLVCIWEYYLCDKTTCEIEKYISVWKYCTDNFWSLYYYYMRYYYYYCSICKMTAGTSPHDGNLCVWISLSSLHNVVWWNFHILTVMLLRCFSCEVCCSLHVCYQCYAENKCKFAGDPGVSGKEDIHPKLILTQISFVYNIHFSCPTILKFCTEHGSFTAVLCA